MAKKLKAWWKLTHSQKQEALCRRAKGPELALWKRLKEGLEGCHFVWNAPLLGYFPDFLCEKLMLVVEVDGPCHEGREAYDDERDLKMQKAGYSILRFKTSDATPAKMEQTILRRVKKFNASLAVTHA